MCVCLLHHVYTHIIHTYIHTYVHTYLPTEMLTHTYMKAQVGVAKFFRGEKPALQAVEGDGSGSEIELKRFAKVAEGFYKDLQWGIFFWASGI